MKKNRSKNINLYLILLILTFGLHAVIAFALSPLYSVLASDAVVPTIVSDIVRGLIDILDIGVMSGGFCIISVVFFMNYKNKALYLLIYIGSALFRRIASLGMSLLINRALTIDEIFMSVSVLILDIIMLAIIAAISASLASKHRKVLAISQKASLLLTDDAVDTSNFSALYPFKKLFSKGNYLQYSLLATAVILSAVKFIGRTIALLIESTPSIPMTVGGYVSDILVIVISYALSCLLLSCIYKAYERKQAENSLYE